MKGVAVEGVSMEPRATVGLVEKIIFYVERPARSVTVRCVITVISNTRVSTKTNLFFFQMMTLDIFVPPNQGKF